MDEETKEQIMKDWFALCTKNENSQNPWKIVNETVDFFEKVWTAGYKKGVEIKTEVDNLN